MPQKSDKIPCMFKEHATCETKGQCDLLSYCQRAMAIEQELGYEKAGMKGNALELAVAQATCRHTQVDTAISKVNQYKSEKAK